MPLHSPCITHYLPRFAPRCLDVRQIRRQRAYILTQETLEPWVNSYIVVYGCACLWLAISNSGKSWLRRCQLLLLESISHRLKHRMTLEKRDPMQPKREALFLSGDLDHSAASHAKPRRSFNGVNVVPVHRVRSRPRRLGSQFGFFKKQPLMLCW